MALAAATGIVSEPEQLLANSVANATRFQTITGSNDAAEAAAHIYFGKLPAPANGTEYTQAELEGYRPYAIIENNGGGLIRGTKTGTGPFFEFQGEIILGIVRDVPSGETKEESDRSFMNVIGELLLMPSPDAGILNQSSEEDRLIIRQFAVGDMQRVEPARIKTTGNWQAVQMMFQWGTG